MKQLLLIPILMFCLCSCGTHGVSADEMKAAQDAIQTRFNLKKVNISILSDKRLQVAVEGVPNNDTLPETRQQMTDSIGIICKEYLDKESLVKGSVIFVGQTGYVSNNAEKTQSYKMHIDR